jgi:ribosome-binding protein aMBF1 (putative translation factor)
MMAVLTQAREAAGLSKRDLSEKLERPNNFAHYVESGERQLTVCEFMEYAQACGADPVKLMKQMRIR